MARLKKQEAEEVRRKTTQVFSLERDEDIAVTKPVLLAAVNALDEYLSDNETLINAKLPLDARTGLTKKQKARLLAMVVEERYNTGV